MAGLLSPDPVAATLRRWAAEPFEWGASDCAQSILTYMELATGGRLHRRPAYAGASGALAYMAARGGFVPACADIVLKFGGVETASPERGDVGIVDLPGTGETACLCLGGGMWAARGQRALVITPATARIAWRLPCPRR